MLCVVPHITCPLNITGRAHVDGLTTKQFTPTIKRAIRLTVAPYSHVTESIKKKILL
jgi:hypothetical protein